MTNKMTFKEYVADKYGEQWMEILKLMVKDGYAPKAEISLGNDKAEAIPNDFEWRAQQVYDGSATYLIYTTSRAVNSMMNEKYGEGNWDAKYKYDESGALLCTLEIYDPLWIYNGNRVVLARYTDVGEPKGMEKSTQKKGEYSDAKKRAAVTALSMDIMYKLPQVSVACNTGPKKNSSKLEVKSLKDPARQTDCLDWIAQQFLSGNVSWDKATTKLFVREGHIDMRVGDKWHNRIYVSKQAPQPAKKQRENTTPPEDNAGNGIPKFVSFEGKNGTEKLPIKNTIDHMAVRETTIIIDCDKNQVYAIASKEGGQYYVAHVYMNDKPLVYLSKSEKLKLFRRESKRKGKVLFT